MSNRYLPTASTSGFIRTLTSVNTPIVNAEGRLYGGFPFSLQLNQPQETYLC
ncbi:MAG: hypothetical protein ABFC55_10355 [Tenuifilaceae bacterium]